MIDSDNSHVFFEVTTDGRMLTCCWIVSIVMFGYDVLSLFTT